MHRERDAGSGEGEVEGGGVMTRWQKMTNAEMEVADNALAKRNTRQRRLLAINQKLEAVGLDLDELIELIDARREGSY